MAVLTKVLRQLRK